jgi:hypothetical protein
MTEPTELEAISAYLAPSLLPTDGRVSLLDAALRDAAAATATNGLWLGAVGYLIAIEQLGKTVAPVGSQTDRTRSEVAFRTCLTDFRPDIEDPIRGALYALRCALVHSFGLINNNPGTDKHHVFALTRSGSLVLETNNPRSGSLDEDVTLSQTSAVVNVDELRRTTESCVETARDLHNNGNLALVPGMTPRRVFAERMIRIVPRQQLPERIHSALDNPDSGASVVGLS